MGSWNEGSGGPRLFSIWHLNFGNITNLCNEDKYGF